MHGRSGALQRDGELLGGGEPFTDLPHLAGLPQRGTRLTYSRIPNVSHLQPRHHCTISSNHRRSSALLSGRMFTPNGRRGWRHRAPATEVQAVGGHENEAR